MSVTRELLNIKRGGEEAPPALLHQFVGAVVRSEVSDEEAGEVLRGFCDHGLVEAEGDVLFDAMIAHDPPPIDYGLPGFLVDMPSTGGVGNVTPLVVAAIAAATGLVP